MRLSRTLVCVLALAVVLLAGCVNSEKETTAKTPPKPTGTWTGDAKDFAFTTFAGGSGKASDFAGKPLVLNFWAAW